MERKIYIFSNPKHSGKSTKLMQWINNRNDVGGIVTPDHDGKRFFHDIATGNSFLMEAAKGEENIISVGKYIFSKQAFDNATKILRGAVSKQKEWIIIDEIGPIELRGEGFHNVLKEIILRQPGNYNLVLVVRDTLVQEVVDLFGINNPEDFNKIIFPEPE